MSSCSSETARTHRAQLATLPRTPFRAYLPLNLWTQLVEPPLQLVSLVVLPFAILEGSVLTSSVLQVVVGLGIASALVTTALSMVLDRAWHHLRFLGVLPLWVPYSWMMSLITVRALWQEATGADSAWNKLQRTGVRSAQALETAR